MRLAAIAAVLGFAAPAGAEPRLDVSTAAPGDAWRDGRSSPFVVKLTGVTKPRGSIRVECSGRENNYLRAQDVRVGVPTPVVSDHRVRVIPNPEAIDCVAYDADRLLARWRGTLAWPHTTLPDHHITKLVANRCGTQWCIDVWVDRSHPASASADVDVLCNLHHASKHDVFREAPSSRSQVNTKQQRARIELANAVGATVVTCSVNRDAYSNSRLADVDLTNNEVSITVANTSTEPTMLAFDRIVGTTLTRGGADGSILLPGSITLALQLENQDKVATGFGLRCEVDAGGTRFELVGAGAPIAAGKQGVVTVAIYDLAERMRSLVGPLTTSCEAFAWDRIAKPVRWTGTVTFPTP